MKITDVEAILISIPLRKPTSMSNKTVTAREYVVTRVRTDEGITGSAYTIGGSVIVTAVATNHLKAKDVKDPQDDVGGTKTAVFTESVSLDGVPGPLQDIAHNPGNKLSTKKTATFVVDGGAWKLSSIN